MVAPPPAPAKKVVAKVPRPVETKKAAVPVVEAKKEKPIPARVKIEPSPREETVILLFHLISRRGDVESVPHAFYEQRVPCIQSTPKTGVQSSRNASSEKRIPSISGASYLLTRIVPRNVFFGNILRVEIIPKNIFCGTLSIIRVPDIQIPN